MCENSASMIPFHLSPSRSPPKFVHNQLEENERTDVDIKRVEEGRDYVKIMDVKAHVVDWTLKRRESPIRNGVISWQYLYSTI